MILLRLKQYFQTHQEATAVDVARALDIQTSAAQGMIDFWVKKSFLQACEKGCSKGSCAGCPMKLEKYKWVGN